MRKEWIWRAACVVCLMAGGLMCPLSVCAEEDAAARMEKLLNEQKVQESSPENEQGTEQENEEEMGKKTSEELSMTPMNTFLRTNDEANVRSGPDTSYESLGKTEIGQAYMVTGVSEDGKWYQIYLDGQEAYISAEYMEEIPVDDAVDAELEDGFAKSGDEVEAELQAASEQAAAEQEAAEGGEQQTEELHVEKKANYGLIIAVVFIAAFLISMLTLLKKDQQQGKREEEKLDIIDLEAEPSENVEQEKVTDQTER